MIQNEIGKKAEAVIIGNDFDALQVKHSSIPKNGVRSVDVFYYGVRLASVSMSDTGMCVQQVSDLKELNIVLQDEV